MEPRQKQFSIWYFVIALFLLVLFQSVFTAPHVQTLDYSEFKTLLRAGKIARVTLGAEYVRGQLPTYRRSGGDPAQGESRGYQAEHGKNGHVWPASLYHGACQ